MRVGGASLLADSLVAYIKPSMPDPTLNLHRACGLVEHTNRRWWHAAGTARLLAERAGAADPISDAIRRSDSSPL
jgi:hypothetical protein